MGSVFGPVRFILPVCRLSWFLYTLNIYAHFLSYFSQQLLMTQIWYLVTSFISVPYIVGSVFGPIRFLLPVCRLCWFLYTLNICTHFSSHFSQQILMAEIWYFVTSLGTPYHGNRRGYHKWALAHSSSCLVYFIEYYMPDNMSSARTLVKHFLSVKIMYMLHIELYILCHWLLFI